VWQWIRHGVELNGGSTVSSELLRSTEEELERIERGG
jgi:hypothetical protein